VLDPDGPSSIRVVVVRLAGEGTGERDDDGEGEQGTGDRGQSCHCFGSFSGWRATVRRRDVRAANASREQGIGDRGQSSLLPTCCVGEGSGMHNRSSLRCPLVLPTGASLS